MQIQPDLFWIAGRASNLYLCIDNEGLALIDAGMPGDDKRVLEQITALGHQPDQLTRIVITHGDIDHAGSLAKLQELSGAAVYAGHQTAESLLSGRGPVHLPGLVQWISSTFVKYKPIDNHCLQLIDDGDILPVLGGLQALATPGHTYDHFSYYCPTNGVLFAGDALQTRNNQLQRSPTRITADQEAANASAIHLLELAPAMFACGHGPPKDDHQSDDLMAFFNQLRQNSPAD